MICMLDRKVSGAVHLAEQGDLESDDEAAAAVVGKQSARNQRQAALATIPNFASCRETLVIWLV
jgi:hypothetical protein